MFPDGAVLKGAVLRARTRVARRSGEREDGLLRVPVPCVLKALPSDDVHVPYITFLLFCRFKSYCLLLPLSWASALSGRLDVIYIYYVGLRVCQGQCCPRVATLTSTY